MSLIGFSTGALAYSDFRQALKMLQDETVRAVELSALRISEWLPLMSAVDTLDLSTFDYVSVHLPSRMNPMEERAVAENLELCYQRDWPLILHPDAITDWSLWREWGRLVCLENMDIRKPRGRTDRELELLFDQLPDSRLCFDMGHAWQVDPTMGEAYWILKRFGHRLRQIHISEVNSRSKHDVLSSLTIESFRSVAHMIPPDVPIILETPVSQDQMRNEMNRARLALTPGDQSVLVA
jgi:hypothetical protein